MKRIIVIFKKKTDAKLTQTIILSHNTYSDENVFVELAINSSI